MARVEQQNSRTGDPHGLSQLRMARDLGKH
jgi:hypothetical protein